MDHNSKLKTQNHALERSEGSKLPNYSLLGEFVRQGRAVSLATLIKADPSSDSPKIGAKLLIPGDDSPVGSIHPDLDALLVAAAKEMLAQERSGIVTHATSAGTLEVFIETFPPPQQLIIVGAVHVAVPLSKMAKMLGYKVVVVDPREVFATQARFPEADDLVVEWPEDAFPRLEINSSAAIAVLTHDPKIDVPALKLALDSEARYVGALGSRATIGQRKAELATLGATEEQLNRIHAPIGLKLGSRTPAEIALAVMAEIVAVRRGQSE